MASGVNLGPLVARSSPGFSGTAVFAGLAPDPLDPASQDGRFRRLNVPGVGRVRVVLRDNLMTVAETRSAPDGTWLIDRLKPDLDYVVIGFDDTGQQNAAIQDWVRPALAE